MPARPPTATILVDIDVAHAPGALAGWCETAARRALAGAAPALVAPELSILVADDETVRALNRQWRDIDKPTNVLSFPQQPGSPATPLKAGARGLMLGDIAIALPTVEREAAADAKSVADHLHHLVVHGVLHLLGYDHETDDDAEAMEALEIRILAAAGIADPYRHGLAA